MGDNTKVNDKQVVTADDEQKESLYNQISSSIQAVSSAFSKATSSLTLESASATSYPANFTIGGMLTTSDLGQTTAGKLPGLQNERPVNPLKDPGKSMTEILSREGFKGADSSKPGVVEIPPFWRAPEYRVGPRPSEIATLLSDPKNVAGDIAKDQEIGKFAFDKVQNFLKENKSKEAQEYINEINKELQQQKPPSKYELQMKDFEYAPHGGVGRREWYPGSKGTELRLVDKTKNEQDNNSGDTPRWTLKEEKTGFVRLDDKKDPVKPDFPKHEKFESQTKRSEREADESASDMAKKLNETKDLKSIKDTLEKSWDIERMVKRINEKLQKPLSLSVEKIEAERNSLIASLGPSYKLDLKENGKSIQPIMTLWPYRERHIDYYHHTMSGFDK